MQPGRSRNREREEEKTHGREREVGVGLRSGGTKEKVDGDRAQITFTPDQVP